MKKVSKNVAAFEQLLGLATKEGDFYKPGDIAIERTALQALLEEAQKSIIAVHKASHHHTEMINERQEAFARLPALATRIKAQAYACGLSSASLQDLDRLAAKLRSQPFGKKGQPGGSAGQPNQLGEPIPSAEFQRRNRQLGFVVRLNTFVSIVDFLEGNEHYTPQSEEFSIASLRQKVASLQNLMASVNDAYADLRKAKQALDFIVFDAQSGICALAKKVKKHFLSEFGTTSPAYATFRRIKFEVK